MAGARGKALFKHSVTILWARALALSGAVLAGLDQAAEMLSLATFRRKIDVLGIWPMPRRKANPVGKAGGVCKA